MNNTPDTLDARIAVHESGHLMTAWCCSGVETIKEVFIKNVDGGVLFQYRINDSPKFMWCMVVISLAGLVSEIKFYGKTQSRHMAGDLQAALDWTRKLALVCDAKSALPVKSNSKICTLYSCHLTTDEEHIIRAAYEKAKIILNRMEEPQLKIISMILTCRNLNENMLVSEIGNRAPFSITNPRFILPAKKPITEEQKNWIQRLQNWISEKYKL